ncbi:putative oxidoreductase [Cocos nucifera]|uniref:Putative oxidoreductase n=1 Tax=Cocos nucifera TaxID=13894 RepID=A0A8K0IHR5_COCNU|nr:putative oxidoreductase [Cocos nucifera]
MGREEVRYGIVGVGMMGREHMVNLSHLRSEGASLACVADPHPPSLDLALDLARSLRLPPLAVIDAAKQRPEILVHVGLEYRYMPPVAKLIEIVKSGTLGRVRMVAIREHRFPFLVKVNNWNRFNINSGGTLVEKCCHFFDLMRLFAAANPVCVMASGSMDVNHKDEIYDGKVPDIIDNAYVIVEFDNGSRGMLDLCMFAEGSKNEQEISVVGDIGKGEAFVPESVVHVGIRTEGRAGVMTIKAEDERINCEYYIHPKVYFLSFMAKEYGMKSPRAMVERRIWYQKAGNDLFSSQEQATSCKAPKAKEYGMKSPRAMVERRIWYQEAGNDLFSSQEQATSCKAPNHHHKFYNLRMKRGQTTKLILTRTTFESIRKPRV